MDSRRHSGVSLLTQQCKFGLELKDSVEGAKPGVANFRGVDPSKDLGSWIQHFLWPLPQDCSRSKVDSLEITFLVGMGLITPLAVANSSLFEG